MHACVRVHVHVCVLIERVCACVCAHVHVCVLFEAEEGCFQCSSARGASPLPCLQFVWRQQHKERWQKQEHPILVFLLNSF